MGCVDKKNLNWDVPKPLAEAFDRIVTGRWGPKRKWIGAAAAILMYLESDDERQIEFDQRAAAMLLVGQAENEVRRIAASPKHEQPGGSKPRGKRR
jgi:anthranilate phosphoribosyltransferase